jgi:hypothetical protein
MVGRGVASGRAVLLLAGTVSAALPVRALAGPPLGDLWTGGPWGRGTPVALDQVVVAGCAAALAACWLWLVVCVWLVVARCLRQGAAAVRPDRRVRGCPRLVQALVLLALGVGVTAPAHAAPPRTGAATPGGPGLTGLALPDRVGWHAEHVRVRPGDSLWRVARTLLPDGAGDAAVDRMWRRIAACNRDRLGPDPDLIFPGTLLRVPGPGRALGKDDR